VSGARGGLARTRGLAGGKVRKFMNRETFNEFLTRVQGSHSAEPGFPQHWGSRILVPGRRKKLWK